MDFFEEQPPRFTPAQRVLLAAAVVGALVVSVWVGYRMFEKSSQARQSQRLLMVTLPPPPPPPPPPPQTPPPATTKKVEQRMIAQEPLADMDYRPDELAAPDDAAAEADSVTLGTSIIGNGPADGFGLRANPRGGAAAAPVAARSRTSRWGWYASQVQTTVAQALQQNPTTRFAEFRVEARIWADATGRITRARLASSTGNATVDDAITNQVLLGLILKEPPPGDMPMPIVMRLTARPATVTQAKLTP